MLCSIWSSRARDQLQAAVLNFEAAGETPDPLIHCARPGIKPVSWHCRDATDPIVPQQELLKSTSLKVMGRASVLISPQERGSDVSN